MPSKVKVTIGLDAALVRELQEAGRRSEKSRSRLMEKALNYWRPSRLEQDLKRGCQAMAREDRETAGRHLPAGWEAMI